MFSGIIEQQSKILNVVEKSTSVQIIVQRPTSFNDIELGDSICVNGVCLTAENLTEHSITFSLGIETLKFLNQSFDTWKSKSLNLERSLKFGDRVHGHLVTGHVDQLGKVISSEQSGECWLLTIALNENQNNLGVVWKKGSIAINGISLTVNDVVKSTEGVLLSVCLIPETIQKTNLSSYGTGDFVMIETDYLAKAYFNKQALSEPKNEIAP